MENIRENHDWKVVWKLSFYWMKQPNQQTHFSSNRSMYWKIEGSYVHVSLILLGLEMVLGDVKR